ncbi:MAG: acyl carrier protein [Proteobacteria bacterium]|nr:acyl carrier protein [Pseudomonadota bacterium]
MTTQTPVVAQTPAAAASTIFEMLRDEIYEKYDGIEKNEIRLDSNFEDDLGMDSLDTVEIIMFAEKIFQITIPDDEAEHIKTLQDLVKAVGSHRHELKQFPAGMVSPSAADIAAQYKLATITPELNNNLCPYLWTFGGIEFKDVNKLYMIRCKPALMKTRVLSPIARTEADEKNLKVDLICPNFKDRATCKAIFEGRVPAK